MALIFFKSRQDRVIDGAARWGTKAVDVALIITGRGQVNRGLGFSERGQQNELIFSHRC